ncbi:MAG: hypothetical protein JOZ67_02115 [Gammaproteobacteria bacterium]|nr:hypothetical protein [Gammaproteobacteria bacterium]MBV9697411.1 hypothetical protein [Gammaproteobacteria bacterium]
MSALEPGRRITSRNTFFVKRVVPPLWFIIIGAVVLTVVLSASRATHAPPLPLLLFPPLLVCLIGYFVFRRLVFDLADEVYDEGDALRVRFGSEEERIPLSNVMNISYTSFVNPPRVTLRLRAPGRFGKEVTFSPPQRLWTSLSGRNPLVQDLIERVDAARR